MSSTINETVVSVVKPTSTLGKLFQSRKFVLAIVYLLTQLAVMAIPVLAPSEFNLSALSAVIVGVAIFGITVEDSARAWAENRPVSSQAALRTLIEEILSNFFEAEQAGTGAKTTLDATASSDGATTIRATKETTNEGSSAAPQGHIDMGAEFRGTDSSANNG